LLRHHQQTPMGEGEPVGQLLRRLVRGGAIKRHHRCRHPGLPPQLRTPSVADGHHFDLVRAPANGLFESMNDHVVWSARNVFETIERRPILRGRDT
jgi:hypothetical protein